MCSFFTRQKCTLSVPGFQNSAFSSEIASWYVCKAPNVSTSSRTDMGSRFARNIDGLNQSGGTDWRDDLRSGTLTTEDCCGAVMPSPSTMGARMWYEDESTPGFSSPPRSAMCSDSLWSLNLTASDTDVETDSSERSSGIAWEGGLSWDVTCQEITIFPRSSSYSLYRLLWCE